MRCTYASVILLSALTCVRSYNILAVFPHPGKSHLQIFKPVLDGLAEKGHNLTVISHFSLNVIAEKYKEILVDDLVNFGKETFSINNDNVRFKQYYGAKDLMEEGIWCCKVLLANPEVQRFINSNEKFDLVFAEFFNSECAVGFATKFKVPIVGISSTTMMPYHSDRFSNPDNPSYIPNNHLWYGNKMSFLERVDNALSVWTYKALHYLYLSDNKAVLEYHFGENFPEMMKLVQNTSVLLVNSHFSLSFARPLVPGVIEIGGIHIQAPKKLPQNIEKFINESIHGVIYFSLGSMIKGHTFPEEKRKEFLRAFARLPQRVLWKWENETMPGKPDNVLILKWMPQFDILSHPNVKAFISHGGLLGTTEAVHCGVPMIVMPQYGDQHTNAKAVEVNGGGIVLYLREASEEKVYESLKSILDPKFKSKVEALSTRFRDRPMSPMDTAVYWVEYVARHKGAPHLRTSAVDMPLYQYLLLDVLAFLLAIILLFLFAMYKIIRFILKVSLTKKKVKQS